MGRCNKRVRSTLSELQFVTTAKVKRQHEYRYAVHTNITTVAEARFRANASQRRADSGSHRAQRLACPPASAAITAPGRYRRELLRVSRQRSRGWLELLPVHISPQWLNCVSTHAPPGSDECSSSDVLRNSSIVADKPACRWR